MGVSEDLSFRLQPSSGTLEYELVRYLKRLPETPKKVILESVKAFWLPIACLESGEFTPAELEKIGKNSLSILKNQADYLETVLGLEDEQYKINQKLYLLLCSFLESGKNEFKKEEDNQELKYSDSVFM
ncbi:hypothetical protein C7H19_20005 [Aphanothece hegewaldii CCALA 016]|uniref:Uncharacterized protein n=1 Tax=Aphanothece hegewaldii CCALA 016 TaxID=2107694 RepID=A0A2T1LT47_9CHRO|nr:hypothetical protein [Aphanothece hegewaldii]PSF33456.1 hypothetical protein C7H19_20005 [Aphanothece hegewaldii CCALA 016]